MYQVVNSHGQQPADGNGQYPGPDEVDGTPQRTADRRLVAPTPMMEPVMVCVVLTGIFRDSVTKSVMAPAVSAATLRKASLW